MDELLMEIKNVKKIYREDGRSINAVNGVSFIIERGEFTAIVGPSGSGKTTLLNLLSGLDTPTEGNIILSGKSIKEMKDKEITEFRRDHIGFIFQSYNLIPVLSVEENIEYVMFLQGIEKKERHRRVLEMLKKVDLEGYENRLPNKLSGGQQQRVAIARAMVANPDIILADEPTANLDSHTGTELLEMMHSLNRETGMTFIFSTHDKMIMDKASRLIVLRDGQIQEDKRK